MRCQLTLIARAVLFAASGAIMIPAAVQAQPGSESVPDHSTQPETGYLIVVTRPAGALVFVDGREAGRTTLALRLELGRSYELDIGKHGYTPFFTTLKMTGRRMRLDIRLGHGRAGTSYQLKAPAPPIPPTPTVEVQTKKKHKPVAEKKEHPPSPPVRPTAVLEEKRPRTSTARRGLLPIETQPTLLPYDGDIALRIGLGTGPVVFSGYNSGAFGSYTIMTLDFGVGLTIGNHLDLEAGVTTRWMVADLGIQTDLSLLYFPWKKNGPFFRTGAGYFYQVSSTVHFGPPTTSNGLALLAGLGWCWKNGFCLGLRYAGNVSPFESENGDYRATHVIIFNTSFMLDVLHACR